MDRSSLQSGRTCAASSGEHLPTKCDLREGATLSRALCSGLYPRSDYDFSVKTYPEDGKTDPLAYVAALDALPRGSAVVIFTPDDTHFEQGALARAGRVAATQR